MIHFNLKKTAFILSAALLSTAVQASGYHFGTQSVNAQGTANAAAAEAADASTIFYTGRFEQNRQQPNFRQRQYRFPKHSL